MTSSATMADVQPLRARAPHVSLPQQDAGGASEPPQRPDTRADDSEPTAAEQNRPSKGRYILPGLLLTAVVGVVGVTMYPQIAPRVSAVIAQIEAAADRRTTAMPRLTLVESNEMAQRQAAQQTSTVPGIPAPRQPRAAGHPANSYPSVADGPAASDPRVTATQAGLPEAFSDQRSALAGPGGASAYVSAAAANSDAAPGNSQAETNSASPATEQSVAHAPRPSAQDAAKLQAAPMAPAEQVQVLGYVTETASLVAQMREQMKKLQERITELSEQGDDLNRRMLVGEAGIAVANAKAGPDGATASSSALTVTATQSAISCARRPQYTIAAPSPHYVSLTGGPDPLYLGLGDTIPCYGKILQIRQEGAKWVVLTDHDKIVQR